MAVNLNYEVFGENKVERFLGDMWPLFCPDKMRICAENEKGATQNCFFAIILCVFCYAEYSSVNIQIEHKTGKYSSNVTRMNEMNEQPRVSILSPSAVYAAKRKMVKTYILIYNVMWGIR